jgi:hypothetical protein
MKHLYLRFRQMPQLQLLEKELLLISVSFRIGTVSTGSALFCLS